MLGADAADVTVKDFVDEGFRFVDEGFALLRRCSVWRQHVEMDVAVSDMAIGNRQAFRQFFRQFSLCFGHERRKF
ncbi:hypothetical protein D3C87_1089450 [compost metagenome]